jgi:translation initiation factor 2 alpha subunit (eIF-2alpha)
VTKILLAFFGALFEHLTKLVRTDKTASDADETPEALKESFREMVNRRLDESRAADKLRDD